MFKEVQRRERWSYRKSWTGIKVNLFQEPWTFNGSFWKPAWTSGKRLLRTLKFPFRKIHVQIETVQKCIQLLSFSISIKIEKNNTNICKIKNNLNLIVSVWRPFDPKIKITIKIRFIAQSYRSAARCVPGSAWRPCLAGRGPGADGTPCPGTPPSAPSSSAPAHSPPSPRRCASPRHSDPAAPPPGDEEADILDPGHWSYWVYNSRLGEGGKVDILDPVPYFNSQKH